MSVPDEKEHNVRASLLELLLNTGVAVGQAERKVFVGRCAGSSEQMLLEAFASGAMSAGADVLNAGVIPAPTLALSSAGKGCSFMVPADPSLILRNSSGLAIDVPSGPSALPAYDRVGRLAELSDPVLRHKEIVIKDLGNADCPVIIDCSSDCSSLIVPDLLSEMGCDVICIHSDLNPLGRKGIDETDLKDLITMTSQNTGGIGIAVNSDGTRIAAVDESGRYISGETILALFIQYLEPKKVVVPSVTSMLIDELTKGEVLRSGPTDRSIGESIAFHGADIGGGPSGSFYFPKHTLCPDAVYAAALLSKIAGEGRLNEMIDTLPEYCMDHLNIAFDSDLAEFSKKISENVRSLEYRKLTEKDGWRVEMESGWFLIHFPASGYITITAEARDKVYMVMLMDVAKGLVENALK